MRFEVTTVGLGRAESHVDELGVRAGDLQPAFSALVDEMVSAERVLFDSRGAKVGGWPGLKASTLSIKLRRGQSSELLRATGALYRSLTSRGALLASSGDELVFGTRVPYAHWVARKRKPVGFDQSDAQRFARTLSNYLVHGAP